MRTPTSRAVIDQGNRLGSQSLKDGEPIGAGLPARRVISSPVPAGSQTGAALLHWLRGNRPGGFVNTDEVERLAAHIDTKHALITVRMMGPHGRFIADARNVLAIIEALVNAGDMVRDMSLHPFQPE